MKLTYYQGPEPNFGDELNVWLWPKFLPHDFLDDDASELFLGIGSILWGSVWPAAARKIVLGSGYGYGEPPEVTDGTWDVRFVRGPLTAAALGLSPGKAICDGAVLLREMDLPAPAPSVGIAFMPHIDSARRGFWREAAEAAGITFIDPRDSVERVISLISGATMVLTEAMHGAIVADALRVPWVAVRPIHNENAMKWDDWAGSLGIELRRPRLWPSSLIELYIAGTGGRGYYKGRATRWSRGRLAAPANAALRAAAARRLASLARCEPQLSRDTTIAQATARVREAVDDFVRSRAHRAEGALP